MLSKVLSIAFALALVAGFSVPGAYAMSHEKGEAGHGHEMSEPADEAAEEADEATDEAGEAAEEAPMADEADEEAEEATEE